MKSRLLVIVFMIAAFSATHTVVNAQFPILTTIGNYTCTPGQQFSMPVTIINYTEIASISLTLNYNPAVITYNGYSVSPLLVSGFNICNVPYPGDLKFAWFGMTPIQYIDTAVLANLNFTYNSGSCNLVWDTLNSGNSLYSSTQGYTVPCVFVNGTVNGGTPPNSCSNTISMAASGTTVQFSGSSTGVGSVEYHWYFGDGWVDTAQNPVHTYLTAGNYTVTLATFDSLWCYSVSSVTITSSAFNLEIYGDVYADTLLDAGSVHLYYEPFTPPTNTFQLLDSLQISSYYSFSNLVIGSYIVQAQPDTASAYYGNYVPTYYGDTPYWNNADIITTTLLPNPFDIHLVYVPGPNSGSGNITGMITSGSKLFASGTPAVGAEILLTDVNNQVLAVRYSDNAGNFSFDNLAYDTYKVRPEVALVAVTPTVLTLSAANPSSHNINFVITPSGIVTNISEKPDNNGVVINSLYPNPASDVVNIDVSASKNTAVNIECFDLFGRSMMQLKYNLRGGNNTISFSSSDLKNGVYFLRMNSEDGLFYNKVARWVKL